LSAAHRVEQAVQISPHGLLVPKPPNRDHDHPVAFCFRD
jgi:hypothetical protein